MFNFRLYARDEAFDLLRGTLPPMLHAALGDQLERARRVLHHRSAAEVAHAIESLEWLLRESNRVFFAEAMQLLNEQDSVFISRVKALRALMPHIDISRQKHLPKASWADYFAALTLAYVQELLYMEKDHTARKATLAKADAFKQRMYAEMDSQRTSIHYASAIEAMDAVCFAEHLAALHRAKDVLRKAGAKGARLKARPFDALKTRCLKLYETEFARRSNRAAAIKILEKLSPDELKIFSSPEPEITIAKWIGDYKKSLPHKTKA